MTIQILHGNNLEVLPSLPDCSVDAVVTDPPYELGFMGKKWDASGIAYNVTLWTELLRVLKPGGHLLAFGGTRTYHRMACAIEDAGFEIRDSIHWLYGSGFPKSLDVSKAIGKQAGAEREVVGETRRGAQQESTGRYGAWGDGITPTAPATDEAKRWEGWGTALKPAHEPIVVARKPLVGTVAGNVLEYGTGALNIDASRIGFQSGEYDPSKVQRQQHSSGAIEGAFGASALIGKEIQTYKEGGRWPANVLFSHHEDCDVQCVAGCPVAELDRQSGTSKSQPFRRKDGPATFGGTFGNGCAVESDAMYADSGGASRFFYCAKPSKRERNAGLNMCQCDKLGAWEHEDQQAQHRADTAPSAKRDTGESGTPDNSAIAWNTTSSGNSIMEQSQTDTKSTIATTTNSTMTSATLNSSTPQHTNDFTPDANFATASGGNPAKFVENSNRLTQITGISAVKDGRNMGDADHAILGSSSSQSALGSLACPKCDGIKGGHPTVKPLALMRYLVRLVTPLGGTVLDPFAGSGTTLMAATLENFHAIGIEMTDEYLPIIEGRVAWAEQEAQRESEARDDQPELPL